eukprot:scaffold108262_cov48-Phaeocystis_antarctica.AAC.1
MKDAGRHAQLRPAPAAGTARGAWGCLRVARRGVRCFPPCTNSNRQNHSNLKMVAAVHHTHQASGRGGACGRRGAPAAGAAREAHLRAARPAGRERRSLEDSG